MNPLAVAEPAVPSDDARLMRRVPAWMAAAYPHERAEAVNALARAYLHGELAADARANAETALTHALDDPEPCVRHALAEAFASSRQAPRHIVLALAQDISQVSRGPLAHSPLLSDADLVDAVAYGDAVAQVAIARRPTLGPPVAAALAEVGERAGVLALIGNVDVDLAKSALWRALERFHDDAGVRDRLALRPNLPAALRAALAAAAANEMSEFAARRLWQAPRRAERIARDGREQAFVAIAADCPREELGELVGWLLGAGHLTVGLFLRALACGDTALLTQGLAEMAHLPPARVAGWLRDARSPAFAALYARAGLPAHLLPAFRIAVECANEAVAAAGVGVNYALTKKMLAAIEARADAALAPVVALLARLAAEGARIEARESVDLAAAAAMEAPTPEIDVEAPPVLLLGVEPSNENCAPLVELDPPAPALVAAA